MLIGIVIALVVIMPSIAQSPKSPAYPPINPAQARLSQTLGDAGGPCTAMAIDRAAETLFVANDRGDLISWPRTAWLGLRVGKAPPDVMHVHDGPVTAVVAVPGSLLVTTGADSRIRLWTLPGREPKLTLTTGNMVRALAISPDGKQLAAGDDGGVVSLFELPSGKLQTKLTGHTDWILALSFSHSGDRLVSGGNDGQVLLWDIAKAKKLLAFAVHPPANSKSPPAPVIPITALAFRPDGKSIAVADFDGQIQLLDVSTGKLIRTMQSRHASSISDLTFHPGGTVLASAGRDRVIKLWNPDNGQMLANLEGHTAWVEGIRFLEKGARLASVSADRSVRIWDLTPKK
jgi:WD40 repeat protein